MLLRELVAVRVEQLGQDVAAVEEHAPHPREVVEPDLVDDDALRLDAEQVRRAWRWKPIATLQRPTAR